MLVEGVRAFIGIVREDPDTWRLALFPVDGAPGERYTPDRIASFAGTLLAAVRRSPGEG